MTVLPARPEALVGRAEVSYRQRQTALLLKKGDEMSNTLRAFTTWLGFPGLTFDLSERSRRRILWVSALPALIVSAVLTDISLGYALDEYLPPPEFWERVSAVAGTVQYAMLPLGVAVLVAAGLRPWSRSEGSWLLLIGLSLATAAFGLATVSSGMHALYGLEEAQDLRAYTWASAAYPAGFLAIGYFFLAYRALAGEQRPPVRRPGRYRPAPRGPSGA
jgi:hypothetical protein